MVACARVSVQSRQSGSYVRSNSVECMVYVGWRCRCVQVTWLPTHELPPLAQLRRSLAIGCAVVVQPLGSAHTALATLMSMHEVSHSPHVLVTAATYEAPEGVVATLVAIMVPCVPVAPTATMANQLSGASSQTAGVWGGSVADSQSAAAAGRHASEGTASDSHAAAQIDMWADVRAQHQQQQQLVCGADGAMYISSAYSAGNVYACADAAGAQADEWTSALSGYEAAQLAYQMQGMHMSGLGRGTPASDGVQSTSDGVDVDEVRMG